MSYSWEILVLVDSIGISIVFVGGGGVGVWGVACGASTVSGWALRATVAPVPELQRKESQSCDEAGGCRA